MDSINNCQKIADQKEMLSAKVCSQVTPSEFITYQMKWVSTLLKPFGYLYARLHHFTKAQGKLGEWLVQENFLFFLLATGGILIISPRYLVFLKYVVEKFLLQMAVVKPETSSLPYTPSIIIYMIGIFLLSFFLKPKIRTSILLTVSIPLLFMYYDFTFLTLGIFALFLIITYFLIKLPFRRSLVVGLVCSLSLCLVALCKYWEGVASSTLADLAFFQTLFLPMLWYSVYEELPPKRRLHFGKFLTYHYMRIFEAPMLRYNDIFVNSKQTLAQIRFGGIKALYVVLFAALTIWTVKKISSLLDISQLSGFPLLIFSYMSYVSYYCAIVIPMNTFVGTARLFGIPVRDNFHYWLLARTPNEHWRRWNLLFREWVITFVFFPIMRAKQWLFVAVMVSLLISGILHVVARVFDTQINWLRITNTMMYWTLNGLAIYLVIKVPLLFPKAVERLNLKNSKAWSLLGIILTSVFYGVLVYVYQHCKNWAEVKDYLSRLCSL
jgi:hypothetical protein